MSEEQQYKEVMRFQIPSAPGTSSIEKDSKVHTNIVAHI